MCKFLFWLYGTMPLLMHQDDVILGDGLETWRKDPANKVIRKAGDDRSPPWTWITYLYTDGKFLTIPQVNVMVALRTAGSYVGNHKDQLKRRSQSGLVIMSEHCEFFVKGKPVPINKIEAVRNQPFEEHVKAARALGFDLSIKRAAINKSKNVRVRARFEDWSVRGVIQVIDPYITKDILEQLFQAAGFRAGLGDWRPSSPKAPGPYGTFEAKVTKAP